MRVSAEAVLRVELAQLQHYSSAEETSQDNERQSFAKEHLERVFPAGG